MNFWYTRPVGGGGDEQGGGGGQRAGISVNLRVSILQLKSVN